MNGFALLAFIVAPLAVLGLGYGAVVWHERVMNEPERARLAALGRTPARTRYLPTMSPKPRSPAPPTNPWKVWAIASTLLAMLFPRGRR